ncbi:hypothetical protein ALC62_00299 [Cyphomyrmex costatus]|uniref:Uncharacterized protein n=1 Tax=Cyphomyrmex costatus TaxID=456900 RepID=A0A195D6X7_9HYME|nr:hypothetical protein ALC62_00299 [Cyphomyrmex costatus]
MFQQHNTASVSFLPAYTVRGHLGRSGRRADSHAKSHRPFQVHRKRDARSTNSVKQKVDLKGLVLHPAGHCRLQRNRPTSSSSVSPSPIHHRGEYVIHSTCCEVDEMKSRGVVNRKIYESIHVAPSNPDDTIGALMGPVLFMRDSNNRADTRYRLVLHNGACQMRLLDVDEEESSNIGVLSDSEIAIWRSLPREYAISLVFYYRRSWISY